MRAPMSWLRAYCDPPGISAEEAGRKLNDAGIELERIAMLVYQVPDMRLLFDNDLRVLGQFGAGA